VYILERSGIFDVYMYTIVRYWQVVDNAHAGGYITANRSWVLEDETSVG